MTKSIIVKSQVKELAKIDSKPLSVAEEFYKALEEKAKKEIETLVIEAKKNIENEKDLARTELRSEAATLVMAAVEKILQEKMDSKKDEGYICTILSSVTDKSV